MNTNRTQAVEKLRSDIRVRAEQLRAAASNMIDQADQLEAQDCRPVVYFVPVDPADATQCDGCQ